MRILITGGAGFIGSHLAQRLIAEGRSVIVLDDLSTGSERNLSGLIDHPRFTFVKGSVLDEHLVADLMWDTTLVIHLAAAVGVRHILTNPLSAIHTNVAGADVVLRLAAANRQRVLLASTSEVYGKNEADSLCETADSVLGPSAVARWSYATAKKLDEFLALAHAETDGLSVIITRFFNIVGPRQRSRYGMVLPNFIRAALANEPIRVFGDGRQSRNFCYVQDCIDALLALLESDSAEGAVFNIGGPEEISMLDLAKRVKGITGSRSRIITVPYAQAYPEGNFEDMRRRVPCICKISRLTGWRPTATLDQMIAATASYEEQRLRQPHPEAVAQASMCSALVM